MDKDNKLTDRDVKYINVYAEGLNDGDRIATERAAKYIQENFGAQAAADFINHNG